MATSPLGLKNTWDGGGHQPIPNTFLDALANYLNEIHVEFSRHRGWGFLLPTDFNGSTGAGLVDTITAGSGIIGDDGDMKPVYQPDTQEVTYINGRDNYVFIDQFGVADVEDVATGAAAPSRPAGTRLACMVTTAGGARTVVNNKPAGRVNLGETWNTGSVRSVSVAGGAGDTTLSDYEYRNRILVLTGVLTGNRNVIVPATEGLPWIVHNNTSGAFTITVKTSGGTGVTITQGTHALVYSDGTNIVRASPDTGSSGIDLSPYVKHDGTVAFTGDQSMGGNQLTSVGTPAAGTDAANKDYVDDADALLVKQDGTTPFTAPQPGIDPVDPADLATKDYVDNNSGNIYVAGAGLTESPALTLNVNPDNVTTEIVADALQVKDGGIGTDQLADAAVTEDKINATLQDALGYFDISVAAQSGDNIDVTIQAKDIKDNNLAQRMSFLADLSAAAYGEEAATAPDGGWAATTGVMVTEHTPSVHGRFRTDASGTCVIRITHSGAATWHLQIESSGPTYSAEVTFA